MNHCFCAGGKNEPCTFSGRGRVGTSEGSRGGKLNTFKAHNFCFRLICFVRPLRRQENKKKKKLWWKTLFSVFLLT